MTFCPESSQPSMKALKIVRKKFSVVIQNYLRSQESFQLPRPFCPEILSSCQAKLPAFADSAPLLFPAQLHPRKPSPWKTKQYSGLFRAQSILELANTTTLEATAKKAIESEALQSTVAPEMAEFHQRASPEWPDFTE